jgi:hypothetical protein
VSASAAVVSAAGHMLLDKRDQDLARRDDRIRVLEDELRRAKDVVRAFLQELEDCGVDLLSIPTWDKMESLLRQEESEPPDISDLQSIDPELLIQLRDLVRKP